MKKFMKAMWVCAFMLVFSLPILLTGCSNGDLENLKIYTDFKTEYFVGESLDVTNGKLSYTDKDGKEIIVSVKEEMISSFSTATEGEREMIITYNSKTITYNYVVNKKPADVKVGDLYYLSPSAFSNYDGYNDYIYIKNSNVFAISSTNVAPESMSETYLPTNNFTFTKSIENKKVVYVCTKNTTTINYAYTITVENENQVKLSAVMTNVETGSTNTASGVFTKLDSWKD